MPLLLLLLFLAFAQTLSAQHQVLRGQVVYLNSGKQPAAGVQIAGTSDSAGQATPVYSTASGHFQLEFPRSEAGDLVRLSVGSELQSGALIEVVNPEELHYCRLPHSDEQSPLVQIVVCPKGARDQAALGYYRILKHSATRAYAAKQAQFSQLLRAEHRSYDTIAQLSKAIDQLAERMDSLTWYKEALYLASINRDDASARTLEYLRRIEAGEDVQAARQVLDVAAATGQLAKGLSLSESAIEELELRARASNSVFDYKDAVVCYERIIGCLERAGDAVHPLLLGRYYGEVASILKEDGKYFLALSYDLKNIVIQEQHAVDTSLAITYNNLAVTHQNLYNLPQALTIQLKAVFILEQVLDSLSPIIAPLYSNVGMTYYYLDNFKQALHFHHKAIYTLEKALDSIDSRLILPYNNIALTYHSLQDFEQALRFQQKALFIQRQVFDSIAPEVAICYNNIAVTYLSLKDFEKALLLQKKAISIQEQVLDSLNPKLATSYNNISNIYYNLNKCKKALDFQKKTIAIQERTLTPLHPQLATSYENLASYYRCIKKFNKALLFHKKAISMREQILDSIHPALAVSYNNLAAVYTFSKEFDSSIHYYNKTIKIEEQIFDPLHPTLAISYSNIGITYAMDHQFLKAKAAFTKYEKANHHLGRAYYNWTLYYALKNQPRKALKKIEKAVQEGYLNLKRFQTDDSLDSIRDHPKFKRLLKQLKDKLAEEQE